MTIPERDGSFEADGLLLAAIRWAAFELGEVQYELQREAERLLKQEASKAMGHFLASRETDHLTLTARGYLDLITLRNDLTARKAEEKAGRPTAP